MSSVLPAFSKTAASSAFHLGPIARPLGGGPPALVAAASRAPNTALLFGAFLLLVVYEWTGVSRYVPLLRLARFSTVLAYGLLISVLFRVRFIDILQTTAGKLHVAFIGFTVMSCLWAIVTSRAFESIRPHVDYFGLLIISACLIDRYSRVRWWCLTCSVIAMALVLMNLGLLRSDLRQGVFDGGYFVGDGNDFGWGLSVLAPFTLFLTVAPGGIAFRAAGLLGLVACALGVVGTQSRGATLSILCAFLYYGFFVSRRKVLTVVVLCLAVAAGAAVVSSHYVARLQTLENLAEDNSAQSRLRAWRAATQMALDFPLGVGAGNFNSAYGRYYVPREYEGWGSQRWISAHSVYFRVLGEYGFGGLALLLLTLRANFRENRRSHLALKDRAVTTLSADWPRFVTTSLIAYCISGLFLGGITYPHLYLLTGLTLSSRRMQLATADVPAVVKTAPPSAQALPRIVARRRQTS